MNAKLLSRDAFREGVFARDGGKCVLCDRPAADAHHILERRLFDDGGYYLDNGASVCSEHHEHLYEVQLDKWGNEVLPNGQRLRGELWHDESVQKVLAAGGVLGLFTNKVKYGRTHHLPWSEGMHDDDRMLKSLAAFDGNEVIATRKMDGENTTMMRDCFHARSIDGRHHASRDWAKGLWASIAQDIPEDWRVCGENLFAKHSIAYEALPTYFMGFSIWTERNVCLGWDETLEWFELLGIEPVPVLYRGPWNEKAIRALYDSKRDWNAHEGYVVRTVGSFSYAQFRTHVGKFVRKGHVNTAKHWMFGSRIERNGLASA